jgi:hypothetical protein
MNKMGGGMGGSLDAIAAIEVQALVAFLHAGVQYQSRVSRIMRTVSECLHFGGKYYNSTKSLSGNIKRDYKVFEA